MLTQTAKYAVRALVHLAQQDGLGFYQTKEIAQTIDVPANYLGKTMQKLAHARVLDSQKGLHGGFRLSRTAARINLYEIMVAVEAIPRDMVGEPDGGGELPSDVYAKFEQISGMYMQFLKETTLADLMPPGAKVEAGSTEAATAEAASA